LHIYNFTVKTKCSQTIQKGLRHSKTGAINLIELHFSYTGSWKMEFPAQLHCSASLQSSVSFRRTYSQPADSFAPALRRSSQSYKYVCRVACLLEQAFTYG
ncbi:UNVERIFIED_CONTAM: hypothetical protein K2H54_048605, partial [Gekko kuhli]